MANTPKYIRPICRTTVNWEQSKVTDEGPDQHSYSIEVGTLQYWKVIANAINSSIWRVSVDGRAAPYLTDNFNRPGNNCGCHYPLPEGVGECFS
jgi:hypothetical protein